MNRKDFLLNSAMVAFSISAFGNVVKTDEHGFKGDCSTTNDILGPFYRPDAPTRSDLTFEGLKGNRIMVKGKVFGSDCVTPLENALVEIWHCNTAGQYDNETKAFKHRAKWSTNKMGEYSFKTILPGKYLNGKLYRPSHIHFRISHPKSKALISQIYFKGDPHITEDPWASAKKAEHRVLPIIAEGVHGDLAVNFNIYLQDKA